jgi:hypothetical protein
MIFRLSQRLNAKIKAGTLPALAVNENPLADWSAHLFVAGRTQYILLSNTRSLYSTVMFAKGITNPGQFLKRASTSIRALLVDDGQETTYERLIAPAWASVRFARALNRSVTGSMNELIRHAEVWLADGDLAPHEVGVPLNDTLMSAIAPNESTPYGRPRQAFQELVNRLAC